MKKIKYFAISSEEASSGVYRKITNFVNSANKIGYSASFRLAAPGAFSHFKLAYMLATTDSDIAVVRANSYGLFWLQFGIWFAKIRGVQIIVDVATPLYVSLFEQWNSDDRWYIKSIKIGGLLISGPWCLWFVDRVVQYAPESTWFSLGLRRKTLTIGNGIDVDSINVRSIPPIWPARRVVLLGVGGVSIWHGYDIIIKAMHRYLSSDKAVSSIVFNIVGSGPELNALKILVNELSLNECVFFHGPLSGVELYNQYQSAHFGVSSFGLHRIGLSIASPLKSREYAAVGLPFIYATDDPDFPNGLNFCYKFNSTEDYGELINFFHELSFIDSLEAPRQIRQYAHDKLDFTSKVANILNLSNC